MTERTRRPTPTREPTIDSASPSSDEVRAQLARLKASSIFEGSERLIALLTFVVEETLAGRGDSLKETVIGNEVYGREPAYDPRIDSAVRVEARRLRRKLGEYYEAEGASDIVGIAMPAGKYSVIITRRTPKVTAPLPGVKAAIFEPGRGAAVAVFPFRSLSQNAIDSSLAEGLTDELIYALGKVEGLHIVSRGIVFRSAELEPRLPELASELGVDAIVLGTIRRGSGRVRVTIEVANANGFVIWSDRFDQPDGDLVDLEENIAATVLNRVRLDSSKMRANQIRPGPQALDALGAVVRGRQFLDLQTPDNLRRALSSFEQIAQTAPDYARGHSGIADCFCDMFRLGLLGHAEARVKAEAAARRALAIDPSSVEAHASLGAILAWFDFDRRAEDSFVRSIGLGENARARRVYGAFLTILERHDEAQTLFREARALEPFSVQQDIAEAVCDFQSRRFEATKNGAIAIREESPPEVKFHLALSDLFGGRGDLAGRIARSWTNAMDFPPTLALARAELLAWMGEPDLARSLLAAFPSACRYSVATLALSVGDDGRAAAELAACIESREMARAWLRTDARIDRLRNSAIFAPLLMKYQDSLPANR
ncbi:hypothetical protein [Terrarubrum flagellatum]|uniref:hypothetical protein n=1 Tax=Terrirubrum flagellatum TaxID=2895980 RepID=UPI003144E162